MFPQTCNRVIFFLKKETHTRNTEKKYTFSKSVTWRFRLQIKLKWFLKVLGNITKIIDNIHIIYIYLILYLTILTNILVNSLAIQITFILHIYTNIKEDNMCIHIFWMNGECELIVKKIIYL